MQVCAIQNRDLVHVTGTTESAPTASSSTGRGWIVAATVTGDPRGVDAPCPGFVASRRG
jgi:hypothetical protein